MIHKELRDKKNNTFVVIAYVQVDIKHPIKAPVAKLVKASDC